MNIKMKCITNNPVIMKKMKLSYLALISVAVLLSSCGGLNKMKDAASDISYTVSPKPLEMQGGEVEVTVETKFPPKYFNKKAIVIAKPVLVYDGGETAFDSTTVQGESVEANNKVISFEGGNFSLTGSVPYSDEMHESSLEMRLYGVIGDNSVPFPPVKIADGVIATATLVDNNPKAILVGDKFVRITPADLSADIHYVINRAYVRNSELREKDIEAFEEAIREAYENERKEFTGFKISAYASPDGEYDLNEELAAERQESSERYFKRELEQAEIEYPEGEDMFELLSTAEDWEGFKELVQESDIQDKELILRVLSMHSDPAVREREIKNISAAFEELKEDILPKLRRAKLVASVNMVGYSDDELKMLVDENPDSLKKEEILYAATLFDDMDKKLEIYKKAEANYPDCFRAANGVGYVYVEMGDYDQAESAFNRAKNLMDNEVVKNNLAAVALANGNVEEAEEMLTEAAGAGPAVNYNLGIIKIIQGDYSAAVNYFGSVPSYNAALAQLLNGEPQAALSTLNNVEEENAKVHYLKAIAGARTSQQEIVLSNLRTAIQMDSSLKEFAREDLEFRDFRDNETFTSIVE